MTLSAQSTAAAAGTPEQLGMKDALPLLRETLKQEAATDEALSQLGEGDANEGTLQPELCARLSTREARRTQKAFTSTNPGSPRPFRPRRGANSVR